ncbi:MAG: TonB-dependent receptor [Bacteroidales bacterium]
MNNWRFVAFSLLLLNASFSFAVNPLKGVVRDSDKKPIPGANVWWMNTTLGATTDESGYFEINPTEESDKLLVSFVGYTTDTLTVQQPGEWLDITLGGEILLNEVVIRQHKASTITSRIDPLQTQKITYDELCRAACCNLAESFETNPSVDVSYSDAATGARQIRLLGLSGTYVQMMTEQFPNLQGAASAYGLSYIPGPWMESIQVSKGTSSVKNGYESLTGQINVEYKKPQLSDPLSVNLFAAHTGRLEANVDGNIALNPHLSTGLLLHYSREQESHDENKDGFLDMPKTEQFNGLNRWYYMKGDYVFQALANVLHEKRESGQMAHGNHNVTDPFLIGIETNRGFFFTKNGYILDRAKNKSVALLLSGSYHNQDSYFGRSVYDVNQKNLYANLIFETELTPHHKISTGASFVYDHYKEHVLAGKAIEGLENLKLKRNESVGGVYAQYTYTLDEKLTILAGVRADLHSEYDAFVTPRLHVKYAPFGEYLNLRASAGKGYRVANPLVENSYLLASSRKLIFTEGLEPFESAWNYGASAHASIPLFGKTLSVMLEWYYTDFQKQVIVDLENPREAVFSNLKGRSYAQNTQIEMSYPFFIGFSLTGAFRWTDAKSDYNGRLLEKPLTNRYKGLLTASYQTRLKKWQFDVTSQFNGKGRMPAPDIENPLWEDTFPAFVSLNAQITKNFRTWSVYVGGENLTGYKQNNTIIDPGNPWGEESRFDATMIWGPVHGPKFYIGARWSIPRKE